MVQLRKSLLDRLLTYFASARLSPLNGWLFKRSSDFQARRRTCSVGAALCSSRRTLFLTLASLGGAIALAHPLGASGARIVANLTHNLHRLDLKYALGTACIGGFLCYYHNDVDRLTNRLLRCRWRPGYRRHSGEGVMVKDAPGQFLFTVSILVLSSEASSTLRKLDNESP